MGIRTAPRVLTSMKRLPASPSPLLLCRVAALEHPPQIESSNLLPSSTPAQSTLPFRIWLPHGAPGIPSPTNECLMLSSSSRRYPGVDARAYDYPTLTSPTCSYPAASTLKAPSSASSRGYWNTHALPGSPPAASTLLAPSASSKGYWYAHTLPGTSPSASTLRATSSLNTHMGQSRHVHHHHHHHHQHGHNHHHQQHGQQHEHEPGGGGNHSERGARESEVISQVGLWADVGLTGAKGAAGWLSGSSAMLADAAHSLSDIALSGVTLWSVRAANAPRDKEHPYGHGKFQSLGALVVSGLLVFTGAGIAWHAFGVLQDLLPQVLSSLPDWTGFHTTGTPPVPPGAPGIPGLVKGGHGHIHGLEMQSMGVALSVAVLSVGVKEGLYWATKIVGDRYDNSLMKANAWHHRSDAVSSVAAAVGVGGAMVGIPVLDPAAALLVSSMIIRAGAGIAIESSQELLDSGLPDPLLSRMKDTVCSVPGVQGCHHIRGRKMGSHIHLDTHIDVAPELTVRAGHDIGTAVRDALRHSFPAVTEVFVHVDPAEASPGDKWDNTH